MPCALDADVRTMADVQGQDKSWRVRTGRVLLCFARPQIGFFHANAGHHEVRMAAFWGLYGVAIFDSTPIYEENIAAISELIDVVPQ